MLFSLPEHVLSNPMLVEAIVQLLPAAISPWRSLDLPQLAGISIDQADQLESALIEAGLLTQQTDGRWLLADQQREALLVWVMNQGRWLQAREIVFCWRDVASATGNLQLMALCHAHLANILLFLGQELGALAELHCCLSLQLLNGDLAGVARTSWSLGAYAALRWDAQSIAHLSRAASLAEQLALPEAPRYRQRLEQAQSALGLSGC